MAVDLHLTDTEQAIYEQLKNNNWRLEQEKIPQNYVLDFIAQFITLKK
ncbi:hypothetical protein EVA_19928 [gut metagenome]|uniref:Uncharacterized protein n=1 Tax=gut metagenome TaxID=749906 RepID=J9FX84_9ZZZZ